MPLHQDLVFLILQFCKDEKFKETAHMLERESGLYFDMSYFNDLILNGKWHEAERYLSGFTGVDDDRFSAKIYFEIRKQKFLEALDSDDRMKALEILRKDLKVFSPGYEKLFREMTQLLILDNFREHKELSTYDQDIAMARSRLAYELQRIIKADPSFCGKLEFPTAGNCRLRQLINQSLNWQHTLCKSPQWNPIIETLLKDHACTSQYPRSSSVSTATNLLYPQAASASAYSTFLDSSMSSASYPAVSNEDSCLSDVNAIASISHDLFKLSMNNCNLESREPVNSTDLPKTVAKILIEDSCPSSMEFHPIEQVYLLVGTKVGDTGLWNINTGKKVFAKNFKIWNIGACSMIFKVSMIKDPNISVNCVAWSPNGSHFAVAFSKHIVHLYCYLGFHKQMEIDAHVGGVNAVAFSEPNNQLLVITGGDDKIIKVWYALSGVHIHSLSGHEAPIHSVCSHFKEGVQLIFSTSVDGQIKAWSYDNLEARVHFAAPGLRSTRMVYSADGKRLFLCGTSENGESFLVEWNETEGSIKRTYEGLSKCSSGIVQFDTSRNKLLAAGDDHRIKFWDMNKVELFTAIDIDGGLPQNPHIRFNKDGKLLAVFANENKIKILSTLHTAGNRYVDTPLGLSVDDARGADGNKYVLELIQPSQCQHLRLVPHEKENKILKLIYNNAGNALLALRSNGTHYLWKWSTNAYNLDGMASTQVLPGLWLPRGCSRLMTNDLTGINPEEEAVPCFAVSNNDAYLVSASGGKISLFNMLSFKTMISFMPPSPAATCIAFYPQDNNIVAIGMDDSTIVIYNVRLDEVVAKLIGHSKRVTGLIFSTPLGVLVSAGADSQLFTWDSDTWDKITSRFLQIPDETTQLAASDTCLEFSIDREHFIAVNETHLAIYEGINLDCIKQWIPGDSTRISQATFSCDGKMLYTSFEDGTISVFVARTLELTCRISLTAYYPLDTSVTVYPAAIAAHPTFPTQFAVGFSDGAVVVVEPEKPDDKWGVPQPEEEKLFGVGGSPLIRTSIFL